MKNITFNMPIDDILYIRERGLVVTGKIEYGNINIGDKVRFETPQGRIIRNEIRLDGIEIFAQTDTLGKESNVGLFFKIPYIRNKEMGLEVLPIRVGDSVTKDCIHNIKNSTHNYTTER